MMYVHTGVCACVFPALQCVVPAAQNVVLNTCTRLYVCLYGDKLIFVTFPKPVWKKKRDFFLHLEDIDTPNIGWPTLPVL